MPCSTCMYANVVSFLTSYCFFFFFSVEYRFLDAGRTTLASHFDMILVSETLRMPHYYVYPYHENGYSSWSRYIRWSLPHNVRNTYNDEVLRKIKVQLSDSNRLRVNEPRFRSIQLSDHLPVRVKVRDNLFIGTWNVAKKLPLNESPLLVTYTR